MSLLLIRVSHVQQTTFEWFSRFKAGRTSVKDDLYTGRPLSIRKQKMHSKSSHRSKKPKEYLSESYQKTWISIWNVPNHHKE
ncbi:hypothetical protein LAZ67_15001975 [Cordylochernes scorpioides]|uniref:Transposase n=1 Tax=Cordylochernes scorpioides TaxID=51811 RepID=A0ABY6LE10_9ARAC|nr:hypothetical protein LAZ67_15001975 [Cordylochernes scorpioides]